MTMKKLIIFGSGDIAELANFYFNRQKAYEVVAFSVDPEYIKESSFCGLPVVPSSELVDRFSTEEHEAFIALSYSKLNALRRDRYLAIKAQGYGIASYISDRATVLTEYPIGENCFILEDNTIQPFTRIGNNVTLWSGNHIGHHSVIGDHTFIASHVVISGGVTVGEQCFIGVNATVRDHVAIGNRCVIGAGALLLADAQDEGVYMGTGSERSRVPSTRLRNI
ncbi:transferase [Achromobacter sp. HZ28]|nr:transferase [Achromobacter sp. HZ28]OWT76549.1 transferase [Achromobacter sp. HZ34]